MFKGKITKIPKSYDINTLIGKKMYNRYSLCPFDFYHTGRYETILIDSQTWKGKKNPSKFAFLKFWERNQLWKKDHWKCLTCGTEWDSESYPINTKDMKGF